MRNRPDPVEHVSAKTGCRLGFIALGLVLVLAGCVTAPREYREPAALTQAQRTAQNLLVFDKAWTLVDENYFDSKFRGVDWKAQREKYRPEAAAAADDESLYRVINRMAAELKESHLHAMSPRRAYEFRTDHQAAVGINMQLIDGKRVVSYVLPGSPAEKAGIKRGWIASRRDGVALSADVAKDKFVAHLGVPITFTFIDEKDQEREFVLQPELLKFEQLVSRPLADGAWYLRFDGFDKESLFWLSGQLKLHRAAPAVVIDLRFNHGGNVLALSIAVAEFFGPGTSDRGKSIGHWIRRNGTDREHHSISWFSAHYPGRVVILNSPGTASAAEIFSHVLQYNKRAAVIGRKSEGAVIVSTRFFLPGGGMLQVPVRDYVGLDGQRLEGRGVKPDIEVPTTLATLRAGMDVELDVALAELKNTADTGEVAREKAAEAH